VVESYGTEARRRYRIQLRPPEVYAAGVDVPVPPPEETPIPCGVLKTGYPSEQMAKTAAHSIAVETKGEGKRKEMPFSMVHAYFITDTGNMGRTLSNPVYT
jgi:sulfide:quinone oxidoreductase